MSLSLSLFHSLSICVSLFMLSLLTHLLFRFLD